MLERCAGPGRHPLCHQHGFAGDLRGLKGTLRDSGAANAAVDDDSGRHRRTAGAYVSSLFAP
jgi:hypothetical protein